MLKICPSKWKMEDLDLTTKIVNQTASKPKKTYTNVSILEPTFWHMFRIGKICLYAQIIPKKKIGPLEMHN